MKRRALKYAEHGDPRKVLQLASESISTDLKENEVLVRWLASPINPADLNKMNGVYMVNPPLPAVGGSEGMGRVVKVGPKVTRFHPGEKVASIGVNCACWTDLSIVNDSDLYQIDQRITPIQGATLLANPTTAWVMLRMGGLENGDWIVQNAANSHVGRAVIEVAREKGYHTINVVRDRPDIGNLKNELRSLGADVVLTEDEVKSEGRAFKGKPKLALNGVGGKSCLQISNLLDRGGLLITYGGMGRKPHEISTTSLVFNNIKVVGVIIGIWMRDPDNKAECDRMLRELQDYLIRGVLHPPPMEEHSLENYAVAVENSIEGKNGKQIFIINEDSNSKL